MLIVLATGPKAGTLKLGRQRWIFRGDKNPLHDLIRRGSKAVGPELLRHVKDPLRYRENV
jgi:hypothetical protein